MKFILEEITSITGNAAYQWNTSENKKEEDATEELLRQLNKCSIVDSTL